MKNDEKLGGELNHLYVFVLSSAGKDQAEDQEEESFFPVLDKTKTDKWFSTAEHHVHRTGVSIRWLLLIQIP